MHIRRLRLDSDSDSEEQNTAQPHTNTVTHQSSNASNVPPDPVEISDDDFIDVSDSLSPPAPPPQPVTGSPVSDFLSRLGLALKSDWLSSCLLELQRSVTGFEGFDVATKAKLCFEQFLFADMNFCGSGVLPPNVDSMHLRVLSGPYVLQVDEILNISCPLRSRYEKAPPGLKRCLKLSMTDGVQRVFGMEYRPIQALEVCASAGLKVAISNVHVRRGLLMLVPETIEILGGLVEQLDAARKWLVDELNKPPRGKRTKNGVLPPLATRATLAAWPPSGVDNIGHSGSTLHSTDSFQANNQGAGPTMSGTANSLTTENTLPMGAQTSASNSIPHLVSNAEAMNMHVDTYPVSHANSMANQFSSVISEVEEMHIDATNVTRETSVDNQSSHMLPNAAVAHEDIIHITSGSSVATECSPVVGNVETDRDRIHVTTDNAFPRRSVATECTPVVENVETDRDRINVTIDNAFLRRSVATECSLVVENVETDRDRIHVTTHNAFPRRSSSTVSDTSDILMVDASDHILTPSRDQEVPFTYLANLSAKWAAMKEKAPFVRGKIKCFLTGVKGFQYKKRTTYELLAYVDDGSLISEIFIDHDVVQKGIGYSPEEVTAALSSPDMNIVYNMKDTMRKFQAFLANFEGVILVELNRKSSLPLAVEMSQGCSQSDAWLLLRRVKSLHPPQFQKHCPSDPIELSP